MLQTIFDQTVLSPEVLISALIGTCTVSNRKIYNREKCIALMIANMEVVDEENVSKEAVSTFFDQNIAGAFFGPHAPIFMA